MTEILRNISLFKEYLLLLVIVTLIVSIWMFKMSKKATLTSREIRVIGIFAKASTRENMAVIFSYCRLLFVISCIISMRSVVPIQYIYLLILSFLYMMSAKKWKLLFLQVVVDVITILSFVILGILVQYLTTVSFEITYLIVYIAIGFAVSMYSIYVFFQQLIELYDIKNLGEKEKVKKVKKKRSFKIKFRKKVEMNEESN